MPASRRLFLGQSIAFAALNGGSLARAAVPLRGGLNGVHPLRSLDASDENWSDLTPIGEAIGNARIVQLGEPGHGSGSAFAAKVRLIKFLHQRLGFDVLVWESGFYDVELTQAALRSGATPREAAKRGIFALWAAAQEVAPMFAYAQQTLATTRPIVMAGFDMQVTADGAADRFAQDLRDFLTVRQQRLRDEGLRYATAALEIRGRLFASNFKNSSDFALFRNAARALLTTVTKSRSLFESEWGADRAGFMLRAIENMLIDGEYRRGFAISKDATGASESGRDARNADNLRWLIEDRYRNRKLIVWAHNAHVMGAFYAKDFHDVHLRMQTGDMVPMGVLLRRWFARDLYTIGTTAYAGADQWATGGPRTDIAPAAPGTLEARLHALGKPFSFVDLKSLSSGPDGAYRLRAPKFDEQRLRNALQVYDGLLYIDQMAPATPLKA